MPKESMGNLVDSLREYFENIPQEQLDKDWAEIEYLNDIGPDALEYARYIKQISGDEDMSPDLKGMRNTLDGKEYVFAGKFQYGTTEIQGITSGENLSEAQCNTYNISEGVCQCI